MVSLLLLLGAALVCVLVAVPTTLNGVQHVDDAVLRFVVRYRVTPLVWLAKGMSLLGSGLVNWPLRVLATLLMALQRRWLQLAAFALAVVSSEILIGVLKAAYARERPPGSLINTTGYSFPSGHAIAGAVTAVGLVICLLPPGRTRWRWEVWAVVFSFVMALSRVYLSAHWLSDVVAGGLLGAGLALGWPALLQAIRHRPDEAAVELLAEPENAEGR